MNGFFVSNTPFSVCMFRGMGCQCCDSFGFLGQWVELFWYCLQGVCQNAWPFHSYQSPNNNPRWVFFILFFPSLPLTSPPVICYTFVFIKSPTLMLFSIKCMRVGTDIPDWCYVEACGSKGKDSFTEAPPADYLTLFHSKSPVSHHSKVCLMMAWF